MNSFRELLEAKVTKNLTSTTPAAPGERKFMSKFRQIKDILASFRQPGNQEMFDGKIVKIYPREQNRYGYDNVQSIKKYDESIEVNEDVKKHRPKDGKRHIFINGKWVGTTSWSKTNKQAIHDFVKTHPEAHPAQIKVAVGESEHWIQKAIKHPGALTKKAKAAGESNSEFEQQHKGDSDKTGEQARLALTLKKMHESVAKSTQKNFADSKGKMKPSSNIDDKSDKKDKVKEFISKVRKKD
jgi:hypothetical protein